MSEELKKLSESFKEKVAKGEARWAGSGYKGKGYTYDSSEMSDQQKWCSMPRFSTGFLKKGERNTCSLKHCFLLLASVAHGAFIVRVEERKRFV